MGSISGWMSFASIKISKLGFMRDGSVDVHGYYECELIHSLRVLAGFPQGKRKHLRGSYVSARDWMLLDATAPLLILLSPYLKR